MRQLVQIAEHAYELVDSLLCLLDYPEWEAGQHCCSLFIGFIREEIFKSFNRSDTCFLEVADDDAVLEYLVCAVFENLTHPTPVNFGTAVGDKTCNTRRHFA